MGSKTTCPACRAYTSNVYFAFQNGEDCPHCGLDARTATKVLEVQRQHADSEIRAQYDEMAARALSAETKLRLLAERWREVRGLVNEPLSEVDEA